MAIVGPNSLTILTEGKPLLVVVIHHPLKQIFVQRDASLICFKQQLINLCPPALIECQPDSLRPMAKHQTQKFTDPNELSIQSFPSLRTNEEGTETTFVPGQGLVNQREKPLFVIRHSALQIEVIGVVIAVQTSGTVEVV
jgi:hypothetical protein